MALDALLHDYDQSFPWNGSFELQRGQNLRRRAVEEKVPNEPGIYLVYGRQGGIWELLYIGKAGTLHNDGSFSYQKLLKRLTKGKQDGVPRRHFFHQQMEELGLEALKFRWFVTFTDSVKVIPAQAEVDLLQAYFSERRRLPPWNKSI